MKRKKEPPFYPLWASQFFAKIVLQGEKLRPKLEQLMHASVAVTTATATFKFAIEVMPFAISVLTLLATLPLFGVIFPSFLSNAIVISLLACAICTIACYGKYNELVTRALLDSQTQKNTDQLKLFEKKIDKFDRQNRLIERKLQQTTGVCNQTKALLAQFTTSKAAKAKNLYCIKSLPLKRTRSNTKRYK